MTGRQLGSDCSEPTLDRVDYIPFMADHTGRIRMADLGGYGEDVTLSEARKAARVILGLKPYAQVSIEHRGVILAVVRPAGVSS